MCLCTQSVCHCTNVNLKQIVVHKIISIAYYVMVIFTYVEFLNTRVAMYAGELKTLAFLRLSILFPSNPDLPPTLSYIPHMLKCLVYVKYAGLVRSLIS